MADIGWHELASLVREYARDPDHEAEIAHLSAELIRTFAWPPLYSRYFAVWEEYGFHLTPLHFYQPIPDSRRLPEDLWARELTMAGVDMNDNTQLEFLTQFLPRFQNEYADFPKDATSQAHEFYFDNPQFSGTDALALYGMVRHFQPARIIEVGSGYSTRLEAKAILVNGSGKLFCIEPCPQDVLRSGFPGLTELVEKEVQNVSLELFETLEANDILFIDSSHVVRIGGDVDFLFLEVLPRLKPGVVIHVHDIYFPLPARRDWVMEERRFWSEQQLLHAFLMYNTQFEVLLANAYAARRFPEQMKSAFPTSPWWGGGSFWMRRRLA